MNISSLDSQAFPNSCIKTLELYKPGLPLQSNTYLPSYATKQWHHRFRSDLLPVPVMHLCLSLLSPSLTLWLSLPLILTIYSNIHYVKVTIKKKSELVGALQLGTVETPLLCLTLHTKSLAKSLCHCRHWYRQTQISYWIRTCHIQQPTELYASCSSCLYWD